MGFESQDRDELQNEHNSYWNSGLHSQLVAPPSPMGFSGLRTNSTSLDFNGSDVKSTLCILSQPAEPSAGKF